MKVLSLLEVQNLIGLVNAQMVSSQDIVDRRKYPDYFIPSLKDYINYVTQYELKVKQLFFPANIT